MFGVSEHIADCWYRDRYAFQALAIYTMKRFPFNRISPETREEKEGNKNS